MLRMRVGEGLKTFGITKKMYNSKSVSLGVKWELYERVMKPTATYEAETNQKSTIVFLSCVDGRRSVGRPCTRGVQCEVTGAEGCEGEEHGWKVVAGRVSGTKRGENLESINENTFYAEQ